jgi:hypothetical protein
VQFDLPQRGFLDPNTIYLRYRLTQTSGASAELTLEKKRQYAY